MYMYIHITGRYICVVKIKRALAFCSQNLLACSWIRIHETNLLRIQSDLDPNHWFFGLIYTYIGA
jgi:hypothetical protein